MEHRAVSHFLHLQSISEFKKKTTGGVKHFDVCTCLRWCLRVRFGELHGHRKVRHVLGKPHTAEGNPMLFFGKTNLKATRGPTVHQATQAHAEMRQECVPVRSARKR